MFEQLSRRKWKGETESINLIIGISINRKSINFRYLPGHQGKIWTIVRKLFCSWFNDLLNMIVHCLKRKPRWNLVDEIEVRNYLLFIKIRHRSLFTIFSVDCSIIIVMFTNIVTLSKKTNDTEFKSYQIR